MVWVYKKNDIQTNNLLSMMDIYVVPDAASGIITATKLTQRYRKREVNLRPSENKCQRGTCTIHSFDHILMHHLNPQQL